ncbi:FliH/SctL family protein [Desulfurivibrio dismutans]|uniref:FliH/SctL family protein n=1 Tax=Desulfurivibrio dismutans TaxID=1398908 RepID=UPI0023D9D6D8|nr:FliH/SctL family protein [Desulfurivibrio alkaliphilus]MDF1614665.1 FliH/SctL family protein [Desulfurivibrio alkaliphilus]
MSKKRKNPATSEFVELTGATEQAPPQASEFLSFAELWQRTHTNAGPRREDGEQNQPVEPEPAEPDQVELARREAAEILAAAREEAERLQQEALAKGRAEGERKGRAEAKKEYSERLAELKKLLAEIQLQRGAIIQRYREDLLVLVQAMTDCLVHHEVTTNPEVIKSCLQKATGFVVENSSVQACINPEDLRDLREAGLRDPTLLGGKNRIELVEDPAVARGGCLLKSAFGEVDATMDNSRKKLYQAVSQAFEAVLAAHAGEDEEPPAEAELAAVWSDRANDIDETAVAEEEISAPPGSEENYFQEAVSAVVTPEDVPNEAATEAESPQENRGEADHKQENPDLPSEKSAPSSGLQ